MIHLVLSIVIVNQKEKINYKIFNNLKPQNKYVDENYQNYQIIIHFLNKIH